MERLGLINPARSRISLETETGLVTEGGCVTSRSRRRVFRLRSVRTAPAHWPCRLVAMAVYTIAIFFLSFLPEFARTINQDVNKELGIDGFLGPWALNESRLEALRQQFKTAKPYPHVVIDNFFAPEIAARIESRFPIPNGSISSEWISQGWHVGEPKLHSAS